MPHSPRSSRSGRDPFADASATDADAIRDFLADATELAEETAALRREAAELLRRSRWYKDECRRELLLQRRWTRVPRPPGGDP
jgi:hypothetical protein